MCLASSPDHEVNKVKNHKEIEMNTKGIVYCIAVLAAVLIIAAPAGAQ
jgi:hypothetical protein